MPARHIRAAYLTRLAVGSGSAPVYASSVSRNGFTFPFVAPAQVGEYALGEKWVVSTSAIDIDPPTPAVTTFSGVWDDVTACTFQDSGDTVTKNAHGLTTSRQIVFSAINSTTGIAINTYYWVVSPTTNTFQLSLTQNGSAIALTTNGTGTYQSGYQGLEINGAMLNPGNRSYVGGSTAANSVGSDQGFDQRDKSAAGGTLQTYNAAYNIGKARKSFAAGEEGSYVKTTGRQDAIPAAGTQYIERMEVLTIVAAAPPAGSFRPPLSSTDKTSYFKLSDVDLSFLPSLALPSGATVPTLATQLAILNGPYPVYRTQNTGSGRMTMPRNDGQKEYGQDIAHDISICATMLLLDIYSASEKLAIAARLIQMAIDIADRVTEGGRFPGAGAGEQWRRFALAFAAKALASSPNIAKLTTPLAIMSAFAENTQHFVVSALDVARPRYSADLTLSSDRIRTPYYKPFIGTEEWGEAHTGTPARDGANWTRAYRDINSATGIPTTFAVIKMGLEALWNNTTFLNYHKRAYNKIAYGGSGFSPTAYGNRPTTLTQKMWDAYPVDSSVAAPTRTAIEGFEYLVYVKFDDLLELAACRL